MHKDEQGHLQHTTDYRNAYIHVNMHRIKINRTKINSVFVIWKDIKKGISQGSILKNLSHSTL